MPRAGWQVAVKGRGTARDEERSVRNDLITFVMLALIVLAGVGFLSLITRVRRRIDARCQDIQIEDQEDTDSRD